MAERGLEEILKGTKVKRLLKAIRSIIYPIKDNLRTLDDDICIKTLRAMQNIVRKHDKIAENFVQYFHILLPSVEILKNKHKCAPKAPLPRATGDKKIVKLINLKRNVVDMSALVQETLEYFEKHGGLMAYVTIKKLIPRYESCKFM
jgi:hypothetical protein